MIRCTPGVEPPVVQRLPYMLNFHVLKGAGGHGRRCYPERRQGQEGEHPRGRAIAQETRGHVRLVVHDHHGEMKLFDRTDHCPGAPLCQQGVMPLELSRRQPLDPSPCHLLPPPLARLCFAPQVIVTFILTYALVILPFDKRRGPFARPRSSTFAQAAEQTAQIPPQVK